MKIKAHEFSNPDITVTYDPCICKQSGNCIKELSNVFRDSVIPWVDLDAAPAETIKEQINKCPSGALQYQISKKEVA